MTRDADRHRIEALRRMTERRLRIPPSGVLARDLREGCRYMLAGGGKRIRSTLVLLSCQTVGGTAGAAADAAAAVELMHNFTLVHDDVMDNADERRGRPTVHRKWDLNSALLVGDVLLGAAYERLMRTRTPSHRALVRVFTRGLLDVCDGQALDLEFARRTDVSVREYFRMIGKKTGCLIATATELGGIIGGGTQAEIRALRLFGLRLGRAFQIQDDLLDVVADPRDFGKTVGGDILEGKRTFLLLTARERTRGSDRSRIEQVLRSEAARRKGKDAAGRVTREGRGLVDAVREIYDRNGVLDDARRLVRRNTAEALRQLGSLRNNVARRSLARLAEDLVTRAS
jgi:geranylgeranyl diphosphate synthase type II